MNNFYEELFKTQKSMLDSWKNMMQFEDKNVGEDRENITFADYFGKLAELNSQMFKEVYNSPRDFAESAKKFNIYDNNMFSAFNPQISTWKNMMGINDVLINNAFKSPTEIWSNVNTNFNAYMSAYQLYKNLISQNKMDTKGINEAFTNWRDDFSKYVKNYLVPMAPENFRAPMTNYIDMANNAYNISQAAMMPWIDDREEAKEAILRTMQQGPESYFNYLIDMQKKMMDSLNIMGEAQYLGLNKEVVELQKKAIEKATKYNSALGNYYQKVYEVLNNAGQDVVEEFQKAAKEGLEPKTFEEFYNFLNKKGNEFIEKSLKAEGFNAIIDETLKAVEEFKEESDDLNKEYYSYLQIARKSDFTKMENQIEKLNEKIEALCEEIEKLKK